MAKMSQTVWFLKGLPGSGKSTWAKQKVLELPANFCKRINKDDLRNMLDAGRYSKGNEYSVLYWRDKIIVDSLLQGMHVIVDDTNFEPKHLERVRQLIEIVKEKIYKCNINLEIKEFKTDVKECIKRNSYRPESERVPERVIWDMYNKYIRPNEYPEQEKINQDTSLPKAIICDLDGTLAIHNGRNPYDCLKAGEDSLNEIIANILWMYETNGYQIIFFSGRNGECYNITNDWLILNGFKNYILVLREEGDNRKDSIVKKEMFDDIVKDKFYIEFVLDDRQQVVDMWRKIGLTCLQVAEGNF